jgi:hypothetical protein
MIAISTLTNLLEVIDHDVVVLTHGLQQEA